MVLETAAGMMVVVVVVVVVVEAVVQMKVRGHRLIFSVTSEFIHHNTLILPKEDN